MEMPASIKVVENGVKIFRWCWICMHVRIIYKKSCEVSIETLGVCSHVLKHYEFLDQDDYVYLIKFL